MFDVMKNKANTLESISFEDMFPETVSEDVDPNSDLVHFDESPPVNPNAGLFDYFIKGAQQRGAFVSGQRSMSKRELERRHKKIAQPPAPKTSYSDKDIEEWINTHRIN